MDFWSRCKLFVLEWKLYAMFGRYNRYRRMCLERTATTVQERLAIATEVLNGPGINTLEAQYNELFLQRHEQQRIVPSVPVVGTPPAEVQPQAESPRTKQA